MDTANDSVPAIRCAHGLRGSDRQLGGRARGDRQRNHRYRAGQSHRMPDADDLDHGQLDRDAERQPPEHGSADDTADHYRPVAGRARGNGRQFSLTVNGTGFRPDSVVYVGGMPYNTQFNSTTQLSVLNAPKRTSAGNTAITVMTGGTATAATNWVFS